MLLTEHFYRIQLRKKIFLIKHMKTAQLDMYDTWKLGGIGGGKVELVK